MKSNTKYKPEYCEMVKNAASVGTTICSMCEDLKICRITFYNWLEKYPEFKEAFEEGKQRKITEIESVLYREATGYMYEEHTDESSSGDNGSNRGQKTVYKHARPSFRAIKYILENKKAAEWKEKSEIDVNIKEITVQIPDIDVEE